MFNSIKSSFFRHIFVALIQLVTVVLISRFYGASGNGQYAVALLLPTLLNLILNFGVAQTNIYFYNNGMLTLEKIISGSFSFCFFVSIIGLMIGGIGILNADSLFSGVDVKCLVLALLVFPMMLLNGVLSSIFQAKEDFATFNLALTIQPIFLLALSTLLVVFSINDIIYLFICLFVSYLLGSAFLIVRSIQISKKVNFNLVVEPEYFRCIKDYGIKNQLTAVVSFLNYRLDLFIVNFFLLPINAGYYVVAIQLSEKYWMISQAVSTVLYPKLSNSNIKTNEKIQYTSIYCRATLIVTTIIVLLSIPILKYIIPLIFGGEFSLSYHLLLALIPGVILMASSRILSTYIASIGRPEINFYGSLVILTLNVILGIIYIPIYGVIAAAYTTSFSYSVNFIYRLTAYKLLSGASVSECFLPKVSDYKTILSKVKK